MHLDRMDICEAYAVFEWQYNVNGLCSRAEARWTKRKLAKGSVRPGSYCSRLESTGVQLRRMGFKPSPMLDLDTLTENGRAIYDALVEKYESEGK